MSTQILVRAVLCFTLHGASASGARVRLDFVGPQTDRQRAVVKAFRHGWDAYRTHCWGLDELLPVSQNCSREFGALGAQIVDALDTLWMMGLDAEYREAEQWVTTNLTFDVDASVSVFETVIRIVGGLLAAHALSGNADLLQLSQDLGKRLLKAWRGGPLPHELVNLRTGAVSAREAQLGSSLAEVGTIQLELEALSALSDRAVFRSRGRHAMDLLGSLLQEHGGLLPIMLQPEPPMRWTNFRVTLGGRGDSFYEYLLKQWLLTNRTEERYRLWYRTFVDATRRAFVGHSLPSNRSFVREVDSIEQISSLMPRSANWHWDQEKVFDEQAFPGMAFLISVSAGASESVPSKSTQESESTDDLAHKQESSVENHKESDVQSESPEQREEKQESATGEGSKAAQEQQQWIYIIAPSTKLENTCQYMELLYSRRWNILSKKLVMILPQGRTALSESELRMISDQLGSQFEEFCTRYNSFKMDHLACFLPGLLALGAMTGASEDDRRDLELAADLAESCARMWIDTPTGLAPESVIWNAKPSLNKDMRVNPRDAHCSLRPEAVESLWYLYLATGDKKYQEWGWSIFQALERHARLEGGGYSGLENVEEPGGGKRRDRMETFLLSETFKYLFLLFADEKQPLNLTEVVLNTEGHPLPVLNSERQSQSG